MNRIPGVVGLAALAACGGGSGGSTTPPTNVSTPAPVSGWPAGTVVQLVNGETGGVVQGQLAVGGVPVESGAPFATAAASGTTVDVAVAGFLPRQTTVKTGLTKISLWPNDSRITSNYTHSLVYQRGDLEFPLHRLAPNVRSVAVTGAFPEIAKAVEIVNSALSRYGVTLFLGGTGDMKVPVRLDPTTATCQEPRVLAYAQFWTANHEISRGEIVVCDQRGAVGSILAHEIGHLFGLSHSEDARDLMAPERDRMPDGFSDREITVLGLMMQRRGGNTWPDNDRNATAAGVQRHVIVN